MVYFCRPHECMTDNCQALKVPRKNHCKDHCCTVPNCPSARNPDLGTSCLVHHNEQVGIEAAARREAEIKAEIKADLRAQAQAEAIKRNEAIKQQEIQDSIMARKLDKEHREREANEKILRSHRAKMEEDEERRIKDEKRRRDEEAAERERERRESNERKKYQTQRQWEKSPRSSGSHFYEKPSDRPAHGHANDIPSSPRNGEPFVEIPHRSRTRRTPESHDNEGGRGEYRRSERERRRSGDSYVHVHQDEDDDEAYHSATNSNDHDHEDGYLHPSSGKRRERGSSNASTNGSGGSSKYRNEKGYYRDEASRRAPRTEDGRYEYDDERQAKRERERLREPEREREKERERERERERNVKSGRGW
ncbi:hypothetical protein IFR04_015886 [Cadophora malorum]|uniref:Uncharacterized protein n=1 Tax=Cadophora malorum TaxID=108018 RepID=A0A8H7T216_9HELO|nr:hypothetical protein IFR04_015886 [Cadophora malorum]